MRMRFKMKLMILITLLVIMCVFCPKSEAMFQSIPSSSTSSTVRKWIKNVRKIEAPNYGMGLLESNINTTTLVPSTSNNIDAHMMKNTEYGAMVLLTKSDYGDYSNSSTTGNSTGIYNVGSELVAAYLTRSRNYMYRAFESVASKYKNVYSFKSKKTGDAMEETARWGGSIARWTYYDDNVNSSNYGKDPGYDYDSIFMRGSSGIYSFTASHNDTYNGYIRDTTDDQYYYESKSYGTRATVVNGQNF